MGRVVRVVQYTLSLALAGAAAWCVWRGLWNLFGFGTAQVASFAGVGPALGYFAAALLSLFAAAEIYPKAPAAEP